jgi:DNA-binding response OmpR family regulator
MAKDRILIVDDERDMRELLEIMLRKEGYDRRVLRLSLDGL